MSAVPYEALRLLARDNNNGDCTKFCGNSYVRWIIAILVICGSIATLCCVLAIAMRRVTGRWALGISSRPQIRDSESASPIRSDLRRPRQQRRCRSEPEEADPVPAYNPTPGLGDAGFYDPDGNYVAHEPPPYVLPKAVLRTEEVELDNVNTRSEEVHAITESTGVVEESLLPPYGRFNAPHVNTP